MQQSYIILIPPQLKKLLKILISAILLCLMFSISLPALAVTIQEVPNPLVSRSWVTDTANLISPKTEAQLNKIISEFETESGTEIAVVTVPDTAPTTPKQFAKELFKYRQIGKKGILFLVSQAERRVEIRTGNGITAILPNAKVRKIIQLQIIPSFKQGDFSEGILVGTQALIEAVTQHSTYMLISSPIIIGGIAIYHAEYIFFGLLGVLLIAFCGAIAIALRPPLLAPEGSSRINETIKDEAAKCANCRQSMEKLEPETLTSYLSQPEQVAQELGNVSYDGWQCPRCQPNLSGKKIHIRAYVTKNKKFTICPTCQELTVERTLVVLQAASETKAGQRLVTQKCHCCDYFQENIKTIPQINSYNSSSSSDGGINTTSWSSSSDSGGDCGSGGDGGSW